MLLSTIRSCLGLAVSVLLCLPMAALVPGPIFKAEELGRHLAQTPPKPLDWPKSRGQVSCLQVASAHFCPGDAWPAAQQKLAALPEAQQGQLTLFPDRASSPQKVQAVLGLAPADLTVHYDPLTLPLALSQLPALPQLLPALAAYPAQSLSLDTILGQDLPETLAQSRMHYFAALGLALLHDADEPGRVFGVLLLY